MYRQISKLIEQLDKNRSGNILLVGDFMLDEYLIGDTERISPEAPVPIVKVVKREYRLGGAGSVAASLAGLGGKTFCSGILGTDSSGEKMMSLLAEAGIDTSCMLCEASVSTTLKQRMIGLAQHRIHQQLLRVDMEETTSTQKLLIDKIKTKITDIIDTITLIAVEDYNKGLFQDSNLLSWLIGQAKKRNIPLIVDPARIPDFGRYDGASLITPNRWEASLASGIEIKSIGQARRAAELLGKKHNIQSVLITLDKDGMLISDEAVTEHLVTSPKEVFDNTGAGDVVLAALAVGLAEGLSLKDSAILANIGGGWEVQQAGAIPITREQLKFELLSQHRRHQGKMIDRKNLLRELDILRSSGKKIAFTNGCFDLLHPGHVSYLEFAREQGDILVVGMNSDKSVRKIKGPNRPLVNQNERARMLAALQAVDYVVIFDEPSVIGLVKEIKPEVLVKGQDYTVEGVVGHEFVRSYGGEIALAPIEHEYSTTKIIKTIIERHKNGIED